MPTTPKATQKLPIMEKVKNLPHKPGVYIYYNQDNQVIYVGKAKDLLKRVNSYFTKSHDLKTMRLLREIASLQYFVVNNEKEAFLLEDNLIKKYRPKFNILLNDDKHYPYIIVTNEKDPQYKYVRHYDKKALKSYGPLPVGSNARDLLTTLQRLFPLRRCKPTKKGRACLYYHLGQCSGACFKEVPWSYYESQLKPLSQFFQGNTKQVRGILEKRMKQASDNYQFEEAQRLKQLLNSLSLATKHNDVILNDTRNRDVVSYSYDDHNFVVTVLFYRAGKLLLKDESIASYFNQDINEVLPPYLEQLYQKNMLPDQLILPEKFDLDSLSPNLKPIATLPITKVEKHLSHLAQANANEALRLASLKSQSKAKNIEPVLKELKHTAKLPKYPSLIEMYDIANIASEAISGAVIVYRNGAPVHNSFRHYNIPSEIPDDLHRLENLIYRRFQKNLVEDRELPDLIIIDGGLTHVHQAKRTLANLGYESIPVIGLVKNSHHKTDRLITVDERMIALNPQTPLYNFLSGLQIRVDAFAKSHYRRKRESQLTKSPLIGIKGLGAKKIQELYKHYPTIYEMQRENFEQLNKIVKNRVTSERLIAYLKTI